MIECDNTLLLNAIKKFGRDKQVLVAIEEMSELQKELLKNINRNCENLTHIEEELADVFIMIQQIIMIYGFNDEDVNKIIKEKQERLKGYMR